MHSPPPPVPFSQEVVVDEVLPVRAERLFRILMQPDAAFIRKLYEERGYWDVAINPWRVSEGP